jgi:hypothetical protein
MGGDCGGLVLFVVEEVQLFEDALGGAAGVVEAEFGGWGERAEGWIVGDLFHGFFGDF